jgi:hypothetical protein
MYVRDKLKEYRRMEADTRQRIVEYLKNHDQEGVVFRHKNKQVTLMVKSTTSKKRISLKEKEERLHKILRDVGVSNVNETTNDIINGMKQVVLEDAPNVEKLNLKIKK